MIIYNRKPYIRSTSSQRSGQKGRSIVRYGKYKYDYGSNSCSSGILIRKLDTKNIRSFSRSENEFRYKKHSSYILYGIELRQYYEEMVKEIIN
jgi:hypothetical protein